MSLREGIVEDLGRGLIEVCTNFPISEHKSIHVPLLNAAIRWANENREKVLVEFNYDEELYTEV